MILGLDISLNGTGIAIYENEQIIFYDTISTKSKDINEKLKNIDSVINNLLNSYSLINQVIIEDTFFRSNVKTLKTLMIVHGVIIGNLIRKNIPYEYVSTMSMKKAVIGKVPKGQDAKKLVAEEVFKIFPTLPKDLGNDATDAIGLILAYIREYSE